MTTAVQTKRCTRCAKDLTGAKRLKDGKGQYWCVDCGPQDTSAQASGLISPCLKCGTPVHAAHLVRKDGHYMCASCAAGVKHKGGAKVAGGDDPTRKRKLMLGLVLIVGGAIAYVLLNYVLVQPV